MKLSELKNQIKELHSLQEETEITVNSAEEAAKVAKEAPNAKITVKELKSFLREEILETLNEEEDAPEEENVELGDLEGEEDITSTIEEPAQDKALELDDIGDTLVQLARRAKDADERELANQILNSAKFAKKTEFKKVEKDAGISDETPS